MPSATKSLIRQLVGNSKKGKETAIDTCSFLGHLNENFRHNQTVQGQQAARVEVAL